MPTLQDKFAGANGGPIQYEGRTLVRSYDLTVAAGDAIKVSFERFTKTPVQGLGISHTRQEGATRDR